MHDLERYKKLSVPKMGRKDENRVFRYNIFEHGYLAYFPLKVTQNSYSDSLNSSGGERVSEF